MLGGSPTGRLVELGVMFGERGGGGRTSKVSVAERFGWELLRKPKADAVHFLGLGLATGDAEGRVGVMGIRGGVVSGGGGGR